MRSADQLAVRMKARVGEGEGVIQPEAMQNRHGTPDVRTTEAKYQKTVAANQKRAETREVNRMKAEAKARGDAERADIEAAHREGLKAQRRETERQHKAYDEHMEYAIRRDQKMQEVRKKNEANAQRAETRAANKDAKRREGNMDAEEETRQADITVRKQAKRRDNARKASEVASTNRNINRATEHAEATRDRGKARAKKRATSGKGGSKK